MKKKPREGSILGVGLANSTLSGGAFGDGVNWAKAQEVGMSLLISPVFGFLGAGMLLLVLKMLVRNPALFTEPEKGKAPPLWFRAILHARCDAIGLTRCSVRWFSPDEFPLS